VHGIEGTSVELLAAIGFGAFEEMLRNSRAHDHVVFVVRTTYELLTENVEI
jgi:hypothetical protein